MHRGKCANIGTLSLTPKRMSSTAVRFGRYSLALALRSAFFTQFRVDANSYFLKNNRKTLSEFKGSIYSTDFRQISLKHFRNNNKLYIYIYICGGKF